MSDPFPEIKSKHSLVPKYMTQSIWEKLGRAFTKTSGFSMSQAIACAMQFDNQHGIRTRYMISDQEFNFSQH